MTELFQMIVCAVPAQWEQAAALRHPLACMGFGIGPGLTLLSRYGGGALPGGLMVMDDRQYDRSTGDVHALAAECLSFCRSIGFRGLVCDFEQPPRRPLESFVAECTELFARRGLLVYVPERYAGTHTAARVTIPTALTSGSLRERLQKAAGQYGAGRLALELEKLNRDIALPSPGGFGRAMTPEELRRLLQGRKGASFYSAEMCVRYFTERDEAGTTHFYLFDDTQTFRHKIELAVSLGIRQGFVLYPDAQTLVL